MVHQHAGRHELLELRHGRPVEDRRHRDAQQTRCAHKAADSGETTSRVGNRSSMPRR